MTSRSIDWLAKLVSGDQSNPLECVQRLVQSESIPGDAAAPLVRLLENALDDELMPWVHEALEKLSSPSPNQVDSMVQVLDRFLKEPDWPDAAYWAITLLGRMGPPAAPSVDRLAALLDRAAFPEIQSRAAWALGKIGKSASAAAPHLARAARNAPQSRLAELAQAALRELEASGENDRN